MYDKICGISASNKGNIMGLNNLKPALGSNKNSGKRLGRGQGSGKGGTSTKGHKGAQSDQGIQEKLVLRVDRCLCKEEFQNLVLKI